MSDAKTTIRIGSKTVEMVFKQYPEGAVLRAIESGEPPRLPPSRIVAYASKGNVTHFKVRAQNQNKP